MANACVATPPLGSRTVMVCSPLAVTTTPPLGTGAGDEPSSTYVESAGAVMAAGPYRYVRNPLYLGGWFMFAAISLLVTPSGALFIAVPDASTFCDRLYRWLARGGGHVNPFTSARDLAGMIERATHLRHVETRTLCTSLSYLNHKTFQGYRPKRLLVAGNGTEISLHAFTYCARLSDRLFGTRLSVYG